MGDVATEAGVSKGTPYLYFPSKESLFVALYQEWDCGLADRIQAAVEEPDVRASNSPRRVLRAVVLAVGAHVKENSQACRVLMEASLMAADQPELGSAVQSAQARYEQSLTELVQAGVAAGEWPPSTDPALEAQLISAALYGLMSRWHLAPHSVSWERIADALAQDGRPDRRAARVAGPTDAEAPGRRHRVATSRKS
jgi:AcrR family transcriptional regulator